MPAKSSQQNVKEMSFEKCKDILCPLDLSVNLNFVHVFVKT